jgi:hypothetical protein
MKFVALEINKRANYDHEYPNEIVGVVQMSGETGKLEVRLCPRTVAEIIRLCKTDVQRVADYNSSQATLACENAAGTIEMQVESGELKQIAERV